MPSLPSGSPPPEGRGRPSRSDSDFRFAPRGAAHRTPAPPARCSPGHPSSRPHSSRASGWRPAPVAGYPTSYWSPGTLPPARCHRLKAAWRRPSRSRDEAKAGRLVPPAYGHPDFSDTHSRPPRPRSGTAPVQRAVVGRRGVVAQGPYPHPPRTSRSSGNPPDHDSA